MAKLIKGYNNGYVWAEAIVHFKNGTFTIAYTLADLRWTQQLDEGENNIDYIERL